MDFKLHVRIIALSVFKLFRSGIENHVSHIILVEWKYETYYKETKCKAAKTIRMQKEMRLKILLTIYYLTKLLDTAIKEKEKKKKKLFSCASINLMLFINLKEVTDNHKRHYTYNICLKLVFSVTLSAYRSHSLSFSLRYVQFALIRFLWILKFPKTMSASVKFIFFL